MFEPVWLWYDPIILSDKNSMMEIFNFSEDLQEKYDNKLQKEMSGAEYEVISRVFKAVTNRKITVPGSFFR